MRIYTCLFPTEPLNYIHVETCNLLNQLYCFAFYNLQVNRFFSFEYFLCSLCFKIMTHPPSLEENKLIYIHRWTAWAWMNSITLPLFNTSLAARQDNKWTSEASEFPAVNLSSEFRWPQVLLVSICLRLPSPYAVHLRVNGSERNSKKEKILIEQFRSGSTNEYSINSRLQIN